MLERTAARQGVSTLGFLLLCLAPQAAAQDEGNPQASFLYENFTRARDVLDAAREAHGGQELVDGSVSWRLSYEGVLRRQSHYEAPWVTHDHTLKGTRVYSEPLQAIRSDVELNYNGPLVGFSILDRTHGVTLDAGASKAEEFLGEDLAKSWFEELASFPQLYLQAADQHAASLRFLGRSGPHDVIQFTGGDGEAFALYLDQETHLLHRVEHLGHWNTKGDRIEWKEFTDYELRGGYLLPSGFRAHVENYGSQTGRESRLVEIDFGIDCDPAEFTVPERYREDFEDWSIATPLPDEAEAFLPVTDLGRGLYIVDLPACDSRSLLIEYEDFAVIVEAGSTSEIATQLLDTAAHVLPDKPVVYVAMTHHHPLYSGGLRPYANRGVTILTTAGNVDYYRDLTTRPYRIQPDAQQMSPREPILEVIEDVLVIADDDQHLELHAFDPGTHVEEFVLPFVPSHKLVITGDFYSHMKGVEDKRMAGARGIALNRVINERKLDVETIVQTWYLTDGVQLSPISVLKQRLSRAGVWGG